MTAHPSLPPMRRRGFHMLLSGKGGVGKSVVARLLAEFLTDQGDAPLAFDVDPVNASFAAVPAFKAKSINWTLESVPEPDCDGRRIELPRGKVVGGSLSINAMVYMRGHPLDYDGWAARHALPEWSFDQCLPYFRRCETSDRGASHAHPPTIDRPS